MIKKLRRRFIIVNMCILTSVLLGVLTGIYAYMYSSEVRISYELMESIINEKDIGAKEPKELEMPKEFEGTTDIIPDTNNSEVAKLAFHPEDGGRDPNENDGIWGNGDHNGGWDDSGNRFESPNKPRPDIPDWEKPDMPPPNEPTQPPARQDSTEKVTENIGTDADAPQPAEPSDDVDSVTEKSTRETVQKPVTKTSEKKTQISSETATKKSTDTSMTSTSATITTTVSDDRPTELKPPFDKKFPDPYKGSVKRAYIMVQFNGNDDIDRVVCQYFENADEAEVKAAAETIIRSKKDRGKITLCGSKLRYMKNVNPRMLNGGGRLLFLDRTLEISTVNRLLFIFIIIGSVGIVVIFGISVMLANWMIKPVDRAWKQQKQFVADASHELKTPLTVIYSNTDVILSSPDDTVKNQAKWLGYIKEETKRMTKLVNNMLYIAKYDSNEIKFTASKFDLSDVMSSICLQYEPLLFEKSKLLETEIEENILINGDEDKLKQLVNILLDNAGKYSSENGRIKASLSREQKNGKIILTVSNTSEYISPEKLDKLFDRFYRLDSSRNRKTGGSGLGLNIAKSIIESHGGKIRAQHENSITSFIVEL